MLIATIETDFEHLDVDMLLEKDAAAIIEVQKLRFWDLMSSCGAA